MNIKAIVFDIDWVIIQSVEDKKNHEKNILTKYDLYNLPWVQNILESWKNRKIKIDEIYKIKKFDKQKVFDEICTWLDQTAYNPKPNNLVVDFIKNNFHQYIFFTNTSLVWKNAKVALEKLGITDCIKEILTFDTWSKLENITQILHKYNLSPQEVLFVDDNINHIEAVKDTKVQLLHYHSYNINIDSYLNG